MKHTHKLALAAAITIAFSSTQAAAFNIQEFLPTWLGGTPAINITPAGQIGQVTEQATARISPAAETLALAKTEQKIEISQVPSTSHINPYTGTRAEIENKRNAIEFASLETDLTQKTMELEKQKFLLDNKDKIFSRELKERLGENLMRSSNPQAYGGDYPANDILPKADIKKKATSAKKVVEAQPVYTPPAYVPPPVPQMVGMVEVSGVKKALLSINGMSPVAVASGDSFMGKTVTSVDSDSAVVGGAKIGLQTTTNTLTNPDKQKLGTLAAGGTTTGASTPIGLPISSTFNGMPMQSGTPQTGAQVEANMSDAFGAIMSPAQRADSDAMMNLEYNK